MIPLSEMGCGVEGGFERSNRRRLRVGEMG